jgi:hypothetical protein
MALDRPPVRRLPLRELMTDAEKRARDLAEHFYTTWVARAVDLRDLSRPVRRKSHYPTMQALLNSLTKVIQTTDEADVMLDHLMTELEDIHEHAKRERFARG